MIKGKYVWWRGFVTHKELPLIQVFFTTFLPIHYLFTYTLPSIEQSQLLLMQFDKQSLMHIGCEKRKTPVSPSILAFKALTSHKKIVIFHEIPKFLFTSAGIGIFMDFYYFLWEGSAVKARIEGERRFFLFSQHLSLIKGSRITVVHK